MDCNECILNKVKGACIGGGLIFCARRRINNWVLVMWDKVRGRGPRDPFHNKWETIITLGLVSIGLFLVGLVFNAVYIAYNW